MKQPKHWRKKPLVVEAHRFNGSTTDMHVLLAWMAGEEYAPATIHTMDLRSMNVPTPEGDMTARPGDWIVKDVTGEFYPVKPDIFAKTYEPEDEP